MGKGVAAAALLWAATSLAGDAGVRTVVPGTVVRWSGAGTTSCNLGDRTWAPQGGVCFFPVDLEAKGSVRLERERGGRRETLSLRVGPYPYPEQRLEVEEKFVHLSPQDEARAARETERVKALWLRETRLRFELPLGPPLEGKLEGSRFGARRVFNGEPRSPHSGVDLKAAAGSPVLAPADGVVLLAEEHFFGGNSVYIDHGGGLVSVVMHLQRIDVHAGDEVRRGQRLGLVGATGRVTGPHLHFGVRWHGARVDPGQLLGPVSSIPEM
jgi:murein DD-endopeptidase MepM/ murein hydrolase activator NlpD